MKAKRLLSVFLCVTMLFLVQPVSVSAEAVPVITSPVNNGYSNSRTPTFMGNAEPNAEIDIYVDDNYEGTTRACFQKDNDAECRIILQR